LVWSSGFGRAATEPLRIIPERGQRSENTGEGSSPVDSKESWYVLHESVAGSKKANAPLELRPEPSLVGGAEPLPGAAVRLAGEAAADEVDSLGCFINAPHIVVAGNVRPVVGEDGAAPRLYLAVPLHG